MRIDDIPDHLGFKEAYLGDREGWLNPGETLIVDPDGKIVAGPAREEETILYAEVHPDQLTGPWFQLDVAGHYARPDVFRLVVDRRPKPLIQTVAPDSEWETADLSKEPGE